MSALQFLNANIKCTWEIAEKGLFQSLVVGT